MGTSILGVHIILVFIQVIYYVRYRNVFCGLVLSTISSWSDSTLSSRLKIRILETLFGIFRCKNCSSNYYMYLWYGIWIKYRNLIYSISFSYYRFIYLKINNKISNLDYKI